MSTCYYFVCKAHKTYCSVPFTTLGYEHLKDKIQQLKDLAKIVKELNSCDDYEAIVVLESVWKINQSSDNLQTICYFLFSYQECDVELLNENTYNTWRIKEERIMHTWIKCLTCEERIEFNLCEKNSKFDLKKFVRIIQENPLISVSHPSLQEFLLILEDCETLYNIKEFVVKHIRDCKDIAFEIPVYFPKR